MSSWSASSRSSLPSEKPIDLSHTVSYTQDLGQNLFGKQYRLDLERAKVEITANRIQYSLEKQQTLMKLFQSYLKTMMMKSFHETSKDSLQRAQRRLSYLSRRYRDGISLRVEYLKAQNDYIAGEQRVQNDYHQMLEDLTELNLESQMNLNEKQIKSFLDKKLTNLVWYELPPVDISQLSNDRIELLEKKLQIYKMLEDKMYLSQKSSLSLNLSYEMSDLDNSWSETFSESTPGSDHYNKSISLNWVLPLGENMAKVEYLKSKIEKQKQENNLNYAKKQVLENNKTLSIKIKNMLQLAKKLEQNINLAFETMQEQNRRFRKGQIDLEQVLTAEENYDVSLKSFVSHYYQYNLLLANLAINQDQFDYFMEEIAKRL